MVGMQTSESSESSGKGGPDLPNMVLRAASAARNNKLESYRKVVS